MRREDRKRMQKGKRRRRRVPIEDMTREELIRARRIARQKQMMRNKRRFYRILLLLFVIFAAAVFFVFRGGANGAASVSENDADSIRKGVGADFGDSFVRERETEEEQPLDDKRGTEAALSLSANMTGVIDTTKPLDVTAGRVGLPMEAVSSNKVMMPVIKAAMKAQSYFTGSSKSVDSILEAYGEGEWHGIRSVAGDIVVFYEGTHIETQSSVDEDGNLVTKQVASVPFKVEFLVYEDGSFVVTGFYENGVAIDDYAEKLLEIIGQ